MKGEGDVITEADTGAMCSGDRRRDHKPGRLAAIKNLKNKARKQILP